MWMAQHADVTKRGRGREPTQVFYQRRTAWAGLLRAGTVNGTLTLPLRGPAATLVADSRRLCERYGLNWYKGWLVHHLQGLRMEEMMPFNLPHRVTQRTTAQHSQQTLDVPVTTGTNMEQGGDWSPDIQDSSPPGFPSPGRSSPHCRHQGSSVQHEGPDSRLGVLQLFLNTPSQHHLAGRANETTTYER
ncbi:hypothetical protein DPEC_G00380120 [Dallia pectoralis]|nr:hypothetical protein DPEC_G00380120 [Dallia pectoralis]